MTNVMGTKRVAMIGLGKLGLPVAVSLAHKFQVIGYDLDPIKRQHRVYEHRETGPDGFGPFQPSFDLVCRRTFSGNMDWDDGYPGLFFADTLREAVTCADVIFLAIQTPHESALDGSLYLTPHQRKDFDYSYIKKLCEEMAPLVLPGQVVVIISTMLPGTMKREIVPILGDKCRLAYNPFFIAMGTVMRDFVNPEFVLLGGAKESLETVRALYNSYYDVGRMPSIRMMSYESAELTKIAYNLFISMKIAYANTLMEISHHLPGCDVDDVTGALCMAKDRLISPRYMRAGMVDGGNCHPRDGIAASWLCQNLRVGFNLFEVIVESRQRQTESLALLLNKHGKDMRKVILGKSFKAETNITGGSPAFLLADILKSWCIEFEHFDPWIDGPERHPFTFPVNPSPPTCYLIATKHAQFADWKFPPGSVVVDPHRIIRDQEGVEVICVGVGK